MFLLWYDSCWDSHFTVYIFYFSSRNELRTKEETQDTVIQLAGSIQSNKVNPTRSVQLSSRPRSGTTMKLLLSFVLVDNVLYSLSASSVTLLIDVESCVYLWRKCCSMYIVTRGEKRFWHSSVLTNLLKSYWHYFLVIGYFYIKAFYQMRSVII